ncbi:FGGY family carbohydrate kinase, partial [Staphylococcus aureus]|nr:FGGY family carbohydrate kinase [Staphylococcus aureus]
MILNEAVLGIDVGTSSVKVIAVSKEGEVLAKVSEELDVIQLQSGYNEQQP